MIALKVYAIACIVFCVTYVLGAWLVRRRWEG